MYHTASKHIKTVAKAINNTIYPDKKHTNTSFIHDENLIYCNASNDLECFLGKGTHHDKSTLFGKNCKLNTYFAIPICDCRRYYPKIAIEGCIELHNRQNSGCSQPWCIPVD